MKKLFVLAAFLGYACMSYGQQDPLYAQYIFNPFIINPAYAGFNNDFSAWASYRGQWSALDGAPETRAVTGHLALADRRMGLGVAFIQDRIGTDQNTQAVATYGYHLKLKENQKLSFGLRAGVAQYRQDFSSLQIDRSDPNFQNNVVESSPIIGAGIIYSTDQMFFAFAVPNLLKASTIDRAGETVLYNQHAYAQAAYVLQVSSRLKVKPFMLARIVQGSPLNLDFGATLSADDSYSVGLFTRRLHTYGVMAKLNVGETLRIGYIFEMPTNKSVGFNFTAHEFTLGLRMAVLRGHDVMTVNEF